MIRTVVCKKDGCTSNKFLISNDDNILITTCNECGSKYEFDTSYYNFKMLSSCSYCSHDVFKVFQDTDKGGIYAKCIDCGNPPEKIFVDEDGIQISYEERLINDVKYLMGRIEQRVLNLEQTVRNIENGQELLEQSIAYVNQFLQDRS